jgi:hypothetical protein
MGRANYRLLGVLVAFAALCMSFAYAEDPLYGRFDETPTSSVHSFTGDQVATAVEFQYDAEITSIMFWLKETGTMTEDITVRIETGTEAAGPSGALVDPSAQITIPNSQITNNLTMFKVAFPEPFEVDPFQTYFIVIETAYNASGSIEAGISPGIYWADLYFDTNSGWVHDSQPDRDLVFGLYGEQLHYYCAATVNVIEPHCEGGIIYNQTYTSTCRTLVCANGSSSMTVKACQKTSSSFEIYKLNEVGTGIQEVCFGDACVNGNGFAVGSTPYCTNVTQDPSVCYPTPRSTGDACDGVDNNCDGRIDEGCTGGNNTTGVSTDLSVAPWYPKGNNYVFVCSESGFDATSYSWNFGDGSKQTGISDNVYHTFASDGTYNVMCTASSATQSATDTLQVTVGSGGTNNTGNNTASMTVSVADWYPKGNDYVFNCNAAGFTPTSYSITFGDGQKIVNTAQSSFYHTYVSSGQYTVTCSGTSGATTASGTLSVTVGGPTNNTGNNTTNVCVNKVQDLPVSCEASTKVSDNYNSSELCRYVTCTSGSGSITGKAVSVEKRNSYSTDTTTVESHQKCALAQHVCSLTATHQAHSLCAQRITHQTLVFD